MDENREEVAVVLVAAGRGERAGSGGGPKQYRRIGGRAIIAHTIEAFARSQRIGRIVTAIHADDRDLLADAIGPLMSRIKVVVGGPTRQASTLNALETLSAEPPAYVFVHDAVRPFVSLDFLTRTLDALAPDSGVLPAVPVSDTIKRATADGMVEATVSREKLHAAQTPQGFAFAPILEAHRRAAAQGLFDFTDDAAIAEWAGIPVRLVVGAVENIKITWPRDIEAADRRLAEQTVSYPDVRTGNGYDVHAFEPGDAVTLCGVAIPHDWKLSGHSDADVGLHALTDALLATCGAGDIGTHFPPSDPQWRGAASHIFVAHAAGIVRKAGGRIANADISLICEAPRIGPHREAMTAAVAAMLGIDAGRVSVKATTNEKLGFVGRREGIAAIATATVVFPGELSE